jgi:flagellar hook protein FlgE
MIDTIYVAMSALNGFQRGLRIIANNTANLNTPGFKSSSLTFADMFYATEPGAGHAGQYGSGLTTLGTVLNFGQGRLQNTGNQLDLAVDGMGLFVLRDDSGQLYYSRDGQFAFDADGVLVSAVTGSKVMSRDASGVLAPVSIAGLRTNAAKATATVTFKGNLSSTVATNTVPQVTVLDRAGTSHALVVRLDAVADSPGTWDVTVLDGETTVGTGRIAFVNGRPDPARSKVEVRYEISGQDAIPLTLDFSEGLTCFDSGSVSTMAVQSQDGYAAGSLTNTSFDTTGTLVLTYSNGQTVKGSRLALARFSSLDAVGSQGGNAFEAVDEAAWETGFSGEQGFGTVRAGMVEVSNVDLAQQFSDLVIMQRGFQASSQVVSTANEMLAELFGMRGK